MQHNRSIRSNTLQFLGSYLRCKSKAVPLQALSGPEVWLHPFVTSTLEVGVWSASRSDRFTPGKDPVPFVQEAGWAPGPVWTCAKNLAPTGIRSPDRPARSQSLYWLSYPGLHLRCTKYLKKIWFTSKKTDMCHIIQTTWSSAHLTRNIFNYGA
jgi:hypothetical protein